jgi:hemoglobin
VKHSLAAISIAFSVLSGCNGDEPPMNANGGGAAGESSSETEETLCAKYGGKDNVASVVQTQVLGAIAGDCRINTFFTSLSADGFTRVSDCLTIQVQELFGCEGIHYEGSEASNGLACRSMAQTHAGLGISTGDFDALIEDVVAGLGEAGIEEADIMAAAPALLGMKGDIVEVDDDEGATKDMCGGGAGGSEQ